ncbi:MULTISPECIES: RNA polymerase sigma factor [unclassified Mesorhizobium]|uniref:RNA polymerase sigma factor n=1 Tax=unclassified Mesorhizobium TaxID=325217 RepID=UPI001927313B|nr:MULTISPECIES: sigma-70 family RNA polymerase sigma factor [unclassified Mesorhizobium]
MPNLSGTVPSLGDFDGNELLNRAIVAYYDDIAAAAGRSGHSRSATLDIVHDLYLKLSARPEILRDKRSLKSYLCQAAVNLGIDRFRKESFEARLFSGTEEEAQAVPADNASPDRALEIEARIVVLRDAIAQLPARRRAVFILHRLHQLSQDEIAMKLNISRNMVDRHLRRAFAHCLDRLMGAEMELSTWSWSR